MKTIAIIQARMSSTRLPGKVLLLIGKISMLEHVVNRVSLSKLISKILVATSTRKSDNPIFALCKLNHISCYRGSHTNVLDRYYKAAMQEQADVVIRITADCPLVDSSLIDEALALFKSGKFDYVTNKNEPEYLRGFEYEIIRFSALKMAHKYAITQPEHEHVTPYIWHTHPEKFKIRKLRYTLNKRNYRLCVDTVEDLQCIRKLVNIYQADEKSYREIIRILDLHPEIAAINSQIKQKTYGT